MKLSFMQFRSSIPQNKEKLNKYIKQDLKVNLNYIILHSDGM